MKLLSNGDNNVTPVLTVPTARVEMTPGFLDYASIVWKFRWTFCAVLGVALAAAAFITWRTPPKYRSELRIEVQDLNQNFMDVKDLDPSSASNPAAPDAYVQLQAQEMQSDALLNRVVKRLRLDQRPDYLAQNVTPARKWAEKLHVGSVLGLLSPPHAMVMRKLFDLPDPRLETAHVRALEVAASNIRVKVAAQSTVVDVYYTAPEPKLPAEFLNALAEEYIAYTMESRWAGTERTAGWLSARLAQMRRDLEDSEQKLQAYARTSGIVNVQDDRESVGEERLRQLQSDWSKAQSELIDVQAKYERAKSSSPTQLPEVLDDPVLRDYSTRLADLEKQASQLSATMKPEHQQVRAVMAQITTVKGLSSTEIENVLGRMRNEYEASVRREALLKSAYQQQYKVVSDQAGSAVPFRVLQQDVESKRRFYQDTLQKVNSAGVATAIRSSNIRVVDAAQPQMLPYRPDPIVNMACGLGGGLLLAVAICFLREASERRTNRLRRPGDAARHLRLREFGIIPNIRVSAPSRMLFPSLKAGQQMLPMLAEEGSLKNSFHAAWDSLLYPPDGGRPPQVISIVSALPQEGKTTVAARLAVALADWRKRVLVIDADLRKPSLCREFDLAEGAGLMDLLSLGSVNAAEIDAAIQHTGQNGVDILRSGSASDKVQHLLASGLFQNVLLHLRSRYDMVVIDTAPVLLFPETRFIGRQSDGVVVVLRSNKNSVDLHQQSIDILRDSGSKVLGTILNGCDEPATSSLYRQYYRYVKS